MAFHPPGGFDPRLRLMVDFLRRVRVPVLALNAGGLFDQLVERTERRPFD
jgi:hypothetical protein